MPKLTALTLLVLMLLFAPMAGWTQSSRESVIGGRVRDGVDGSALAQATVRLLTLPDSALVRGTVADAEGRFSFSTQRSGKHLVAVSYVGYTPFYKEMELPVHGRVLALGDIRLAEEAHLLGEAAVEAKAPEVVLREDTVEYNAASYKVQPGAVVEDLIKKLPGVEIDADGNITAGGKQITQILVDGKEFFGKDIAVALKNLPVEMINKLQVIDRKSEEARLTGVDDGEEEKVINLTVKEEMKKGWFGNVSTAGGNRRRYEGQAMVNRFRGDDQYTLLAGANNTNNAAFGDIGSALTSGSTIRSNASGGNTRSGNVGGNFALSRGKWLNANGGLMLSDQKSDLNQTTDRENTLTSPTYYDSHLTAESRSRGASGDFKLEWKADSLTELNLTTSFGLSDSRGSSRSTFGTVRADSSEVNSGWESRRDHVQGASSTTRLVISRRSARRAGRRTSLSLQFGFEHSDGTSYQNSHTDYGDPALADTSVDQRLTERLLSRSIRLRMAHVEPVGKNRFLQFSYIFNNSLSRSSSYAYNRDGDLFSTAIDSAYSDRFDNAFSTHKLSLSLRTVRKRYRYEVGFAVDPSHNRVTNLLDSTRSIERSLVNYGPSVDFTYIWNKQRTLRLQYRGRTQQPSVSQLQSAKSITNPLVVRLGNPDLAPAYVNNYTLRYNDYNRTTQRTLQVAMQGRFVMNNIVSRTTYDETTGVRTTMPVNVGGTWSIEGNSAYTAPLRDKRFQLSDELGVSYSNQVGFTNGEKNFARVTGFSNRLGLRFVCPLVEASLRANYSLSNSRNTIARSQDRLTMNYGATSSLLFYLPLSITLGSDLSYRGKSGYSASVARNEWLWNAQANISFLRDKQLFAFIRAYDLLHQRTNLSHRVTTSYIEDVTTNRLTDYFLVGVSYRFNTMGGAAPSVSTKKRSRR